MKNAKYRPAYRNNHIDGRKVFNIEGPGMPSFSNEVFVVKESEAEHIARLLSLAFSAGRRSAKTEIRNALEDD